MSKQDSNERGKAAHTRRVWARGTHSNKSTQLSGRGVQLGLGSDNLKKSRY